MSRVWRCRISGLRWELGGVWDYLETISTFSNLKIAGELTSRPLRALDIQHHVHGLLQLDDAFAPITWADRADVDSHTLPRRIEELVAIQ